MAIVEMKKMRLLAMKRDRARILTRLQKLGCVQVIEEDDEALRPFQNADGSRLEEISKQIGRLDWAISKVAPFDPVKKGLFSLKPEKDDDALLAAQAARNDMLDVVKRLEEIERTLGELRSREAKERAQIQQLAPWLPLDVPFERLGETKFTRAVMLAVPIKEKAAFLAGVGEFSTEPALSVVSEDRNFLYVLVTAHRSDLEALDSLVKLTGAGEVRFPEYKGTPSNANEQLLGRIARIEEVRRQLQGEIEALGGRTGELKVARDALALEQEQLEAGMRFAETRSAFFLTAWTPKAATEKVEEAVKKVTADFDIQFADPTDDEKPPTELKNGKFITPFESIVKLYAYPDPRGLDPSFIMMPFFVCFFGLMVSDAAYGIILGALAAFVAYKLRGRGGIGAITAVLAVGGVATLFWGAMLGGWFGIEDIPPIIGFTPMSEPLKMMGLCLILGAVQLFTGLGVAAYMNIRRKKPLDALFDQGFWILLLLGLPMLFVSGSVGAVMAGVGAVGILFTAGRHKKNLFGKITGGLGALYNVTGYISDLLSYARLFGMGLATGVIAMVFNNVANMFMGGVVGTIAGVVILVVGHSFNLAINVLGAYVHSCRLQYIEFFGKFYEDGGVPFKPLTTQGKYVDFVSGDEARKAA